jgi:hypothetical protein
MEKLKNLEPNVVAVEIRETPDDISLYFRRFESLVAQEGETITLSCPRCNTNLTTWKPRKK